MRVMVCVKATKESEAGMLPDASIFEAMTKYNEQLVDAGVMLFGEGLAPTSKAKRVKLQGGKATVTDGPFAETKELLGGFWIWKVQSMDDAIEWLKRSPFDGGVEIDLRPFFELDDFSASLTPALREKQDRLRARLGKLAQP